MMNINDINVIEQSTSRRSTIMKTYNKLTNTIEVYKDGFIPELLIEYKQGEI